jgi:hypothetical protein
MLFARQYLLVQHIALITAESHMLLSRVELTKHIIDYGFPAIR